MSNPEQQAVPGSAAGSGAASQAHCWCRACNAPRLLLAVRMVVCPECGDKRCLHAHNHLAPCATVDLYAHNAWVERMALRTEPATGDDMPQLAAVVALGAWDALKLKTEDEPGVRKRRSLAGHGNDGSPS